MLFLKYVADWEKFSPWAAGNVVEEKIEELLWRTNMEDLGGVVYLRGSEVMTASR